MKPRVTQNDLARAAGVSKAAVSLALNDRPEVSEDLKKRIRELAEELGYRRDPVLSQIAASRWKNTSASAGSVLAYVAVLRPDPTPGSKPRKQDPEKDTQFQGAAIRALELGYKMEFFGCANASQARSISKEIYSRGIKGVILSAIYFQEFVDVFDWKHIAAVAIHDGYVQPPVEQFTPSYVHSLRICWDKALAAGSKRPGIVLFHEMCEHYINFILSACTTKLQSELKESSRLPIHYFDAEDRKAFIGWFKKYKPDVVIGFNDYHYWNLLEEGIRIPEEARFISMLRDDDSARAPWTNPVAGMTLPQNQMGMEAMDRLDALLRQGQIGLPELPTIHRLGSRWQEGASFPAQTHTESVTN